MASKAVEKLMKGHLFDIFSEPNANRRAHVIKEFWVPSSECLFLDRLGAFRGHDAILDLIDGLRKSMDDLAFELTGKLPRCDRRHLRSGTRSAPIEVLSPGAESFQVARIKWAGGPKGELPMVFGEDVATVVEGKIKTMYAFVEEGRVVKKSDLRNGVESVGGNHTAVHVTRII